MDRQAQRSLADALHRQRETILAELALAQGDLQRIAEEREIELEERASEAVVARLLERLDDRGRREIAEIDAALERISAGSYGVCSHCAQPIALLRLRALPATHLCIECAHAAETQRVPGLAHAPQTGDISLIAGASSDAGADGPDTRSEMAAASAGSHAGRARLRS